VDCSITSAARPSKLNRSIADKMDEAPVFADKKRGTNETHEKNGGCKLLK